MRHPQDMRVQPRIGNRNRRRLRFRDGTMPHGLASASADALAESNSETAITPKP